MLMSLEIRRNNCLVGHSQMPLDSSSYIDIRCNCIPCGAMFDKFFFSQKYQSHQQILKDLGQSPVKHCTVI